MRLRITRWIARWISSDVPEVRVQALAKKAAEAAAVELTPAVPAPLLLR